MKTRTVWILLGLVALLGAYVYWFEVRSQSRWTSTSESEQMKGRVFGELAPRAEEILKEDKTSGISIVRGEKSIILERHGDEWWMVKPVEARVSTDAVKWLVRVILSMPRQEKGISEAEFPSAGLAEYGLEKPAAAVTITIAGKTYEVLFGFMDPTDNLLYAKRPGTSDVIQVQKFAVEDLLRQEANDLRERKFLHLPGEVLASIGMASGKDKVVLTQTDAEWRVTTPVSDRADVFRVADLINRLSNLAARDFVDGATQEQLATMGLVPPTAKVELTAATLAVEGSETEKERPATTLLLGKAAPDRPGLFYAMTGGDPVVYLIPEDVLGPVSRDVSYWRDHKLARFSPQDVKTLTLSRPGGSVRLEKDQNRWSITSPRKIEADPSVVEHIIEQLADLTILRYVGDAPSDLAVFGLDEGHAVTLKVGFEGKSDQVFLVGRMDPAEKDVFVMRSGQTSVLTVPEPFLEVANLSLLDLRTRQVADINRYDINFLTVSAGDRVSVLEKTHNLWSMTRPVAGPADARTVGAVLGDLDSLHAERFLAEKLEDPATYGLDKPEATVVAEIREPDRLPRVYRLDIGKLLPEGDRAATISGTDGVFTVGEGVLADLQAEFRDCNIWKFQADEISRIKLVIDSQDVVLRREGYAWKLLQPEGRVPDMGRVRALVGQLGSLRVDRFLSYTGDNPAAFGLDKPACVLTLVADDVEHTLTIGPTDKEGYAPAMTGDVKGIFRLPANLALLLKNGLLVPVEKPVEGKP